MLPTGAPADALHASQHLELAGHAWLGAGEEREDADAAPIEAAVLQSLGAVDLRERPCGLPGSSAAAVALALVVLHGDLVHVGWRQSNTDKCSQSHFDAQVDLTGRCVARCERRVRTVEAPLRRLLRAKTASRKCPIGAYLSAPR